MDEVTVASLLQQQRLTLADLLDELPDKDWEHPSLCSGWRVRDVVAHLGMALDLDFKTMATGLLRSRGNLPRLIHEEALRRATRPVARLVGDLRTLADSRAPARGAAPMTPLVDILVHMQDISIPLGRSLPMPASAARAAADHVWNRPLPFRARRRLRGFELVATDTTWRAGDGAGVEGPIEAILLTLTGRTAGLPALTGPGIDSLRQRLTG